MGNEIFSVRRGKRQRGTVIPNLMLKTYKWHGLLWQWQLSAREIHPARCRRALRRNRWYPGKPWIRPAGNLKNFANSGIHQKSESEQYPESYFHIMFDGGLSTNTQYSSDLLLHLHAKEPKITSRGGKQTMDYSRSKKFHAAVEMAGSIGSETRTTPDWPDCGGTISSLP